MKRIMILYAILAVFLWVGSAWAAPLVVSFGDNSNYWPGWSNGTTDDSKDTIGIPDFSGGQATFSNNKLTNVTFYNGATSHPLWTVLSPGDLFLDVNSNGIWDYVVDITSWAIPGPLNPDPDPAQGPYTMYAIHEPLGSPSTSTNYIRSGSDNTGEWIGYGIRDNHPVAYDVSSTSPVGQVYFSGWGDSPESSYSFDFTGLTGEGLLIPGDLTVGWAMNCANEVIYEKIPNPAPEPATMLLFGVGLCGLAVAGRKRLIRHG